MLNKYNPRLSINNGADKWDLRMTKNVDTPILDAARFRSDHWFEVDALLQSVFPAYGSLRLG